MLAARWRARDGDARRRPRAGFRERFNRGSRAPLARLGAPRRRFPAALESDLMAENARDRTASLPADQTPCISPKGCAPFSSATAHSRTVWIGDELAAFGNSHARHVSDERDALANLAKVVSVKGGLPGSFCVSESISISIPIPIASLNLCAALCRAASMKRLRARTFDRLPGIKQTELPHSPLVCCWVNLRDRGPT
jgi:hypothetical protein